MGDAVGRLTSVDNILAPRIRILAEKPRKVGAYPGFSDVRHTGLDVPENALVFRDRCGALPLQGEQSRFRDSRCELLHGSSGAGTPGTPRCSGV